MGSNDIIILGAIAVPIIAYAGNVGGFKTWVDNAVSAQPPTPTTTWQCVSYPRCNTVAGTDARKKCCCTNKCSLLGRTFKSVDFKSGLCLCNPKASPGGCPYEGCKNLTKGPGCFQCRCSGICKPPKYPNTYPVTTADGSCTCRKMPGSSLAYAFQGYNYEGFDNVTIA